MQDFRGLRVRVWQKSHALTLGVYQITGQFPTAALYGSTSQMRRAAAAIPTNIAEGCGRGSDADFARFLQIALGSASELDYQLLLAHDLTLIDATQYAPLSQQITDIKRMLNALLTKLRANS